jgi:uncharacterized delta-60 repeat protein
VSGLTSGVAYTFTVTATNAIGTGPASAASNSITTNSVPVNTVAPVVSGTATFGQTLSTTTGTWTGNPASFSYAYQWQRGGSDIGSATASTYTLVAGDVGFTIRCVVTATNAAGSTSANSNSTAAVSATVPSAPTIGTATATGSITATVTYTASASNGGATITSYTAVSSPGGITGTLATSGSGTITVSGLSPTTSYTFTVYATNSAGNSPSSAASNSITTPLSYFIGLLGSTTSPFKDDIGQSVAVDSSGNAYVFGSSYDSSDSSQYNFQIAKYNTSGTIQWQRRLGGNGSADIGRSVAVDSSGNVYVCGYSPASGTLDSQIAKYNTSGIIQWQRRLDNPGPDGDAAFSVAVDSSNNVYVCGYTSVSGSYNFLIAKYNTSGTIQWQRSLGNSNNPTGRSVAVDSSGNVYVCGYADNSLTVGLQIAKYNTSGTIQWQRNLGGSSTIPGTNAGESVAVDSSGNVYVCGYSAESGTVDFQIAKYNTSGTIQWQRSLGGSGNNDGRSVAVDSSGNVYVCGYSPASGPNDFQIAKYNTSGTIQWQRRLGASSGSNLGYSVAVDSSGNVYICGSSYASGNRQFLFAKLPGDGSLTGTYTVGGYSFTYAASTLTNAISSLTDSATSLTDAATSLTDAASTLNDTASTLTSSVTTI